MSENDKPEIFDYEVEVDGFRFTRIEARTLGGRGLTIGCVDLLMESAHCRYGAGFRLLHVHPAFRRLGVGRLLVEECGRMAAKAGRKSLGLALDAENAGGREFYKALGFFEAYVFDGGQAVWVKLLDGGAGEPAAESAALDCPRCGTRMHGLGTWPVPYCPNCKQCIGKEEMPGKTTTLT